MRQRRPFSNRRALLREARRQKGLAGSRRAAGLHARSRRRHRAPTAQGRPARKPFEGWPCYHTAVGHFRFAGQTAGIVGCAVGAPFAVLIAEEMFASGCRLLLSVTSAGQIVPAGRPPYFVIIDRALRDEGTSYHYAAAG